MAGRLPWIQPVGTPNATSPITLRNQLIPNPRNQVGSASLGGKADSDSMCKLQLQWKDPWIECEEIKSILKKGNVVGEVGFGFREVQG